MGWKSWERGLNKKGGKAVESAQVGKRNKPKGGKAVESAQVQ
jgi:hypothetical protein